jgi:ketosteroid isomerase-like protein
MICKTLSLAVLFVLLVVRPAGAGSVPSEAAAITAAVNGFHDAFRRGDSAAALNLLAPDAVILESGSAQTREEYAREHLAEDIAFSKAVPGTRSNLVVKQEGNVAWTSAATQSIGTFNGHEVNSGGVELIVLTKLGSEWRIRAIHWSSHAIKKGN